MSETAEKKETAEKTVSEKATPVKEEVKYTKDSILCSERFKNRADILNVLLEEGRTYSLDTVDRMIEKFMKGKVN